MEHHADVVVIGSGLAGLVAAESLGSSCQVTIITKGRRQQSNSFLAQGGIAAAIGANDHWKLHYQDTLSAGGAHQRRRMVKKLVQNGPDITKWCQSKGIIFDIDSAGNMALGKEGAHQRRRILHAGGDATGAVMVSSFLKTVEDYVTWREDETAYELIVHEGECRGVRTVTPEGHYHTYFSKAVILAAGGAGQLYPVTSNGKQATGDGYSLAYMGGALLTDLEMVQFHPTVTRGDNGNTFLVSEAVRGEGARLITKEGIPIMENHPLKDLAPRDIVAREVTKWRNNGHKVFLDIQHIVDFSTRFPTIYSWCSDNQVSFSGGKIPIETGAHFNMGGVVVNSRGQTTLPGLFAAGETTYTGIHGANRLASNSLLEACGFARWCAEEVKKMVEMKYDFPGEPAEERKKPSFTKRHLPSKEDIKQNMHDGAGVIRHELAMKRSLNWCKRHLQGIGDSFVPATSEEAEIRHMLVTSSLVLESALCREESLGAHYRNDSQNRKRKKEWMCHNGMTKTLIKASKPPEGGF
ncbi:L-aspartate oxidase [Bacillus sp. FJAT-44742]|uniref:L-aspartate oxidase n=1 Tax=Bacillus sp. FJAT-44742 TaxID=2014005 RepID=UPI0012FECD6B|nr:L-aspartate oxidase [Bacillus sp. FJAT-44742]